MKTGWKVLGAAALGVALVFVVLGVLHSLLVLVIVGAAGLAGLGLLVRWVTGPDRPKDRVASARKARHVERAADRELKDLERKAGPRR